MGKICNIRSASGNGRSNGVNPAKKRAMLVRLNGIAVDLEDAKLDGDERRIRRCERVFNRERRCVTFADLLGLMGWKPAEAAQRYHEHAAAWERWARDNTAPAYAHAFLCQHLIIKHDAEHPPEPKARMTGIVRTVVETTAERLRLVRKPTPEA